MLAKFASKCQIVYKNNLVRLLTSRFSVPNLYRKPAHLLTLSELQWSLQSVLSYMVMTH